MDQVDFETDVVVVGAGVVGLAIAARLAERPSVLVVERHARFGRETSSRNSEVVHSGIYYPSNSLKTESCIEGRERLYAFCAKESVPHRKCGKIVVATTDDEVEFLGRLESHAPALNVPVRALDGQAVLAKEPFVRVHAALAFSESGTVDSHAFMATLERQCLARGTTLLYRQRVRPAAAGIAIVEGPEGAFTVSAKRWVNAGGNGAAELAAATGLTEWTHRYCCGRYLRLGSRWRGRFSGLVYPASERDGLGVHVTFDLEGNARLGPDTHWLEHDTPYDASDGVLEPDWNALQAPFLQAARSYCPTLEHTDLGPGYVGIRPKLFRCEEPFWDFALVTDEPWLHLLGIESPGLTASLALAERVAKDVGC